MAWTLTDAFVVYNAIILGGWKCGVLVGVANACGFFHAMSLRLGAK